MNTPATPAPTPRTMEQIAQECAEKVCHEGCLLDRGVACELIATAIAQAVEQKDCKIANQAERIRYLEGATNHATGTPLSKAKAECAQAQAALAAKDREIERRKAQLDMWTSAAMDGNATIAQQTARAEKAEAELADERRYVQIEHVASWAKIQDALPPHKEGDDRPLVQVVLDALAELAETKKRNAELQLAVDMAVDHTAERDQLREEVAHIKEWANAKADEVVALERNLYTGDDDEKKALRAERDALRAEVERLKAREGDLVIGSAIIEGARQQEAQTVDELRAALAAAQLDKERLDWLAEQIGPGYAGGIVMVANLIPTHGGSLRAAIDQARSQLPESGKDTP